MTYPTVLAIIPARGGSKRLPRKNILPLAGKSLVAYSIDAAKNCSLISDTIISSDDNEICDLASQMGVTVIQRPQALATDTVSNEYVVEHAINTFAESHYFPDYIVLLQPTSPLRHAAHIQHCLQQFLSSSMKSTLSVCEVSHHPGKCVTINNNTVEPYTCLGDVEKRTQDLPTVYRQNGAIYALKTTDFLQHLKFYQSPCLPYIMPAEESIDIDSKLDLQFCEFLLSQNKHNTKQMELNHVC